MVSAKDWMASLGGSASIADVMAAVRAEHGRGARAYLAREAGVSRDTAGRWLAGKQRPSAASAGRLGGVRQSVSRRVSASRLRRIRRVDPGVMDVESLSDGTPDGTRNPGKYLAVGPVMGRVADLYAAGNEDAAGRMFDAAVMAVYGGEPADATDGIASVLGISDYEGGIQFD